MHGYQKVFFEPKIRIKMLEELVYPTIFRASWQPEDKIRALFRHKLRVERSIQEIRDAKEQKELSTQLRDLYAYYLNLMGCSSADVANCESAVKEEFERLNVTAKAAIPAPYETTVRVSPTVKWIEARVEMLWAQVVKNAYMRQSFVGDELDKFERDLQSIEKKMSEEPDSQIKRAIREKIGLIRDLLL